MVQWFICTYMCYMVGLSDIEIEIAIKDIAIKIYNLYCFYIIPLIVHLNTSCCDFKKGF